jgi:hypothetical protein
MKTSFSYPVREWRFEGYAANNRLRGAKMRGGGRGKVREERA